MSDTATPPKNKRSTQQRKATVTEPGSASSLAGLTQGTLSKLGKIGIQRSFDLILHLPLRYEDETRVYPIRHAPVGRPCLIEAEVVHTEIRYRPKRTLICQIEDGSGQLFLRFLNFYGSQVKALSTGTRLRVFGEIRQGFFGTEMIHPRYRTIRPETPLPTSLTPTYPSTAGLTQDTLRKLISEALSSLDLGETLPQNILDELQLWSFRDSVLFLHQPPPDAPAQMLEQRTHPAWRRLKFDELLAQQFSMRLHYQQRRTQHAPILKARSTLITALRKQLPFVLTQAQERVLKEINADLEHAYPMQRLLQGDVGSGKTVIAAMAALQSIESGYQVAFMAPTEILAEQHYRKLSEWLASLSIEIAWLSGGQKGKDKKTAIEKISSGQAQLVVGTHALFQSQISFSKLGLVIVDEQHRFGVQQRLALRQKGDQPHQLMMSATPIPRTLSMSYYADLDISVIDELPPGRTPIITKLVSDARREEIIQRVRDACLAGRQVYWVCPLIEESEALQLQTVLDTHAVLAQTFPELKVGLLHGRLANAEKATVMASFKNAEVHLLVATTVIEVGVDVPNASLMVIEHAERFGLSQLHQLRGRIGRGATQSLCILLYQNNLSETARARLKIIFETTDGFEIARADLSLRGPGEFLGARQSGVPMLRFADIGTDQDLLESARQTADHLLQADPQAALQHLARWLRQQHEFLKV